MARAKAKPISVETAVQWTIVQVAAHLGIPYQTARNRMLAGDFGAPDYDPEKRRLTVQSERVIAAKSNRKKSSTKTHARRRT